MNTDKGHILIVEDDLFLREAFRLLLEDAGYAVTEAASGAEALAVVLADRPDLVLLDLGLPDRNGLDVARDIKRDPRTAEVTIVALTGRVDAAEKRACLEAGCKAHLAKPFSPRELVRRLPELMAAET